MSFSAKNAAGDSPKPTGEKMKKNCSSCGRFMSIVPVSTLPNKLFERYINDEVVWACWNCLYFPRPKIVPFTNEELEKYYREETIIS